MSVQDLTICSASFHNKRYLQLNWDLVSQLNLTRQVTWVVIENTPRESDDRLDPQSSHFVVCTDGYELDPHKLRPASYRHGISLNKALELVETRFVLILDPDFYIVRRNWINEVVQHMKINGLAFFGAPWHPRWRIKYRYFPCIHCMFIDLAQVSKDSLDFRPGEKPQRLRGRKGIGISEDTGCRIYHRYGRHESLRSECVMPVYRPDRDYPGRGKAFGRLLDRLLPDYLSYLPKRSGYYALAGFRELGCPDVNSFGWEEFVWRGEPFGFHVRGQARENRDRESEIAVLLNIVSDLNGKITP